MKHDLLKTTLRLLLATVMFYLLPVMAWGQGTQPSDGDGSSGNPFQITSRAHLEWMAEQVETGSNTFEGRFFKLMNEIDLSSSPWTAPIGSNESTNKYFAGVFDGNGYRITGLTIPATGTNPCRGLFGVVGKSGYSGDAIMIKNLAIEIAESGIHLNPTGNLEVNQIVGGIAGLAQSCTITNCYVTGGGISCTGDLNHKNVKMGGIAGYGYSLTITNCYATVDITLDGGTMTFQRGDGVDIGGITSMGRVSNCFYTGRLKSHATSCSDNDFEFRVGGIAGRGYYLPTTNCLVLSQTIEVTKDGPLGTIYANAATGTTMSNSNNYVLPETTLNGVTPIYNNDGNGTKWENTTDANPPLSDWLANGSWQANGNYLPILLTTEGQPFHIAPTINRQGQIVTLIHNADELAAINTNLTTLAGNYALVNDIDLTEYINNHSGSWTSIGTDSTPFLGTFDGDGHRITGLAIAEGGTNHNEGGLFGMVGNSSYSGPEIVIKNLGVEIAESGIHISSDIEFGGGIASRCDNSKIQNCYVTGGSIYGKGAVSSDTHVDIGGIVGFINRAATIEHCYSTVNIEVTCDDPRNNIPQQFLLIGGILAETNGGTIINCFATGTLSAVLYNVTDPGFTTSIGGISGKTCDISNCLAANSGGFTLTTDYSGGNYGNINNIVGEGSGHTYTNNYALSDIPKSDGVNTNGSSGSSSVNGADWDGVAAYPAGLFDNDNWQVSASASERTFPKLCYAGTNILMPNQPDVMRPYKVDATTVPANGTFTVDCKAYAKVGEVISITTSSASGYALNGLPEVTGNSGPVPVSGSANSYTFTMPAEAIEVSASFIEIYTVTIDDHITNGSIEVKKADGTTLSSGANIGIVNGTVLTITATPATGYQLKALTADGTSITGTTYTITGNVTLSAVFEPKSGGGSGDGGGTTTPTVYHTVTLPAVEGAITNPIAGDYEVEAWSSFHFYLTLAEEYNKSEPVVTTSRGETITPRSSDSAYIIQYVREPVEIFIDDIVKNPDPVANETVKANLSKVWAAEGHLHIEAATDGQTYIFTADGRLQKTQPVTAGEAITLPLPKGVYIVRIGDERFKVLL